MKYAKFSDVLLSYFRIDDNGETLVLTDKLGYTRAVRLLPYETRPQGDCISRSVLDEIRQLYKKYQPNLATEVIEFGNALEELIDNAPPVEPRVEYGTDGQPYKLSMTNGKEFERPQGEWIIVKDEKWGDNVRCPFCGKELAGTDLNFCCNCGADMRGGSKNE